jgi:hypothetical protein
MIMGRSIQDDFPARQLQNARASLTLDTHFFSDIE